MSDDIPQPRLYTHMTDILLRCRAGLKIPTDRVRGVYFGIDCLNMAFRHEDGKLYCITIRELEIADEKPDTK